ncbi:MAG: hypothetical protein O7C59_11705 [Rickettsia endosymbiont of Ixodes persulcatus]|nr:hypothetical protein [Rickettsia endosymbiont of Ixodes persulcatus]MCZ6909556.1 hypothetical protein [Rickettsia endosymbiont of Ixodes persulcatus]MCZ6910786.1 hypothetical protein [Rickettsia endosymbiont of Ixodes persulcatus]MCZ6915017.1 hypothetical protein [Rickettsia endosymbiont of Ixodes persulcatus]MCZ6919594.1 hypothetical protein [Rickettsia endosymbiont of Ixodes persulcatus]
MSKDPAIFKILLNKNDSYWAMKNIAKVLTGEEKATDAHTVIAIKTGNPDIVKAVIEKTSITHDTLKIASTTENQEIIDLVFNKFSTIPEWLLFNSISSMDEQSSYRVITK